MRQRAGRIVGVAFTALGGHHAFLYELGKMRDLGTLGGRESYALAIDAHGQVVGTSTLADGSWRAFLYSRGGMVDLNQTAVRALSGYVVLIANSINDAGEIAVVLQNTRTRGRLAAVLTPVPAAVHAPRSRRGSGRR